MKKGLYLICCLFLLSFAAKAQCTGCTINVTDIDTNSYTLTTGQVLCVDTNGVIKGNVTLNGGAICNKGIFKPETFTLSSGELTNNGNMSLPTAISLSTGAILTNGVSSVINFTGTLTISGASFTNNGVMNIEANLQNNSGTVTNNSIINCQVASGSGTITNNGVINSN
jgi:hypothetical protein